MCGTISAASPFMVGHRRHCAHRHRSPGSQATRSVGKQSAAQHVRVEKTLGKKEATWPRKPFLYARETDAASSRHRDTDRPLEVHVPSDVRRATVTLLLIVLGRLSYGSTSTVYTTILDLYAYLVPGAPSPLPERAAPYAVPRAELSAMHAPIPSIFSSTRVHEIHGGVFGWQYETGHLHGHLLRPTSREEWWALAAAPAGPSAQPWVAD